MRLMLDTSTVAFQVSGSAGPKNDQNGRQKVDRNGVPMWTLQVIAQESNSAEVFSVTVAGEKPNVTVGERVSLVGLEAIPWANKDKQTGELRSGTAFRAVEIKPLTGSASK